MGTGTGSAAHTHGGRGDESLRAQPVPSDDFLALYDDAATVFWKSRFVTEGDERFVYCEASNESFDSDNEKILKSALLSSRDLFLTKGNVDIDHLTILGYRMGFKNPREFEIGRPVEVRDSPVGVFVKAAIYKAVKGGETTEKGDPAYMAEFFWKSADPLQTRPPMQWFPSVGGRPKNKRKVYDPIAKSVRNVITEAEWVNLAMARQPVNLSVPAVSTQPIGTFGKSVAWALEQPECVDAEGAPCSCSLPGAVAKATLVAGPGTTDPTSFTGARALSRQSLEGRVVDPWEGAFSRFLKDVGRSQRCDHVKPRRRITKALIEDHLRTCERVPDDEVPTAVDRLLRYVGETLLTRTVSVGGRAA